MTPWLHLAHMLKESGPAPDSPALLERILRGGWFRTLAFRFLRLKFTPDILPRIEAMASTPLDERGRLFTQAISLINVRETYKTTSAGRTRLMDEAILRHAGRFEAVRLIEAGVSDGVSCLALLSRLPNLKQAVLTDRHPEFLVRRFPLGTVFLDGERRLLGIKLLGFYLNLSLDRRVRAAGFTAIPTLNPLLRERFGIDAIRPFDVLSDVLPEPVQVIKCANIFNCKYFPDETILRGVSNLGQSLVEGGLLFISQNNDRYPDGEAYFVLERRGGTLNLVEERNGHEALRLFQGGRP